MDSPVFAGDDRVNAVFACDGPVRQRIMVRDHVTSLAYKGLAGGFGLIGIIPPVQEHRPDPGVRVDHPGAERKGIDAVYHAGNRHRPDIPEQVRFRHNPGSDAGKEPWLVDPPVVGVHVLVGMGL